MQSNTGNDTQKLKNALEHIRPNSRQAMETLEKLSEDEVNELDDKQHNNFNNKKEVIIILLNNKRGDAQLEEDLSTLNVDLWSVLCAKAEGEAEEQLESCTQGEGLWAYLRIHLWFTRTTDQGRSMRRAAIMQPPKCTHECEISAAIER